MERRRKKPRFAGETVLVQSKAPVPLKMFVRMEVHCAAGCARLEGFTMRYSPPGVPFVPRRMTLETGFTSCVMTGVVRIGEPVIAKMELGAEARPEPIPEADAVNCFAGPGMSMLNPENVALPD